MSLLADRFVQTELEKLDLRDRETKILRWFVDLMKTGNMTTKIYETETYFLVKYADVIKDLSYLKISERTVSSCFSKYVNCGLMKKRKENTSEGAVTYFHINEELLEKMEDNINTVVGKDIHTHQQKYVEGYENNDKRQQYCVQGLSNPSKNLNSTTNYYTYKSNSREFEAEKQHFFNKIAELETGNANINYKLDSLLRILSSHQHYCVEGLSNPSNNLNSTTTNYYSNKSNSRETEEKIQYLQNRIASLELKFSLFRSCNKNTNFELDSLPNILGSHQQEIVDGHINLKSEVEENDEGFKINSRVNIKNEVTPTDITNTDKDKIKAAVSVYYDPKCFSDDLWENLVILFTQNSFTEDMTKQYITYIQSKVEVKKPDSKINYFYIIVTKPSFVGQFLEEAKTKSEKIEKINAHKIQCSSCETSYNFSERRCPNCELDVANNGSSEYINFHKALYSMNENDKDALNDEKIQLHKNYMGVSSSSNNFNDELRKLYKKYGLSHPIAKIGDA